MDTGFKAICTHRRNAAAEIALKNEARRKRFPRAPNQIIFLYLNPRYVALGFEMPMSSARAIRYRRLALAEQDKATADLLLKLADECDRGVLCTAG